MADKPRVILITTGVCEQLGLPDSLAQLFPTLDFKASRSQWDSFTSNTLRPLAPLGPNPALPSPQVSSLAQKLAKALVAEVEPGRRASESPPEMVILIDDLELANLGNEPVVLLHIRQAVQRHLDEFAWPSAHSQDRARRRVRERCSFHLLVPLLEAYFFGEPQPTVGGPQGALLLAGAVRPSLFDRDKHDVEAFLVDELDFADRGRCPDGTAPWATQLRERHPKQYLRFLCNPDPKDPRQVPYREGKGGVAALRRLDWPAVLASPARAKFVRSLFADIADRFQLTNPCPGELASETAPKSPSAQNRLVLRNL